MATDAVTAMERSHDPSWEVRRAGASALGALLPDADAFARLVALLDDDDTGVGEQAALELVQHGGRRGLAAVARAYATLDDDIGYFLSGALGRLWHDDGYPLPTELRALGADPDPDVVRGAQELAEYLGTDR